MSENNYLNCPDDKLLSLLNKSDKHAFDQIYNRYWKMLFLYLSKVIESSDDAKDILQEIFISLWVRRDNSEDIVSLKSYLFNAAKYRGFNYIRENTNKSHYLDSVTRFFNQHSPAMNEQFEADELSLLIDKEIDNLPPKMREVFILSRKENMSHKMISEKLMISDKTVKKQINNVLKDFRLKFITK